MKDSLRIDLLPGAESAVSIRTEKNPLSEGIEIIN